MQVRFNVPEKYFLQGIPCRVDLQPGQKVGDYRVEKLLGSGTFGMVYKVTNNHRPYALKLLKLWEVVYKNQKENVGERFLYEFHAAQTHSDYLVHSHEFGEIDNNPFFIMDYIANGDVRSRIGKMSVDEIAMIGCDTLKGLRDLHQVGIIHRDIKPDNVLIGDNGKALLTDFGISAFVNHQIKRKTAPNMFGKVKETFGTYAYIPPEQLVDKLKFSTTTAKTDLWAWGVMMYELFSGGEYPWGDLESESDLIDFIRNAQSGNMVNNSAFHSIPGVWAEVLKSCLQSKFENRADNVHIVLNSLDSKNHLVVNETLGTHDSLVLHIMQGVESGRKYVLQPYENIFSVGRSDNNKIVIEDFQTTYISRFHSTIECVPSLNGWFIRDGQWCDEERRWKKSTNGTYVNSNEVDKNGQKLKDGDMIIIGDTTIRVESRQSSDNLYTYRT